MRSSTSVLGAQTIAAFRKAAPSSPSVFGARRLRHSSSIIAAASARMVTKKKISFLTTGPISAISRVLAAKSGSPTTRGKPVMTSCTTTTIRMTVVIWKNCLQIDTYGPAHEADAEQHREADAEQPAEHVKNARGVELDRTEEHQTVSTPSRNIIRKTNRKTPERLPVSAVSFCKRVSISPFSLPPCGSSRPPC